MDRMYALIRARGEGNTPRELGVGLRTKRQHVRRSNLLRMGTQLNTFLFHKCAWDISTNIHVKRQSI